MTEPLLIDARWLEPPEPMERVLNALNQLQPKQSIRFLIHREPVPLYEILHMRGFRYEISALAEGCYALNIMRNGD